MLKLLKQRYLLWQLIKREVVGRYRGSALGLGWSFVNPLLLLVAYTFVFGLVFKSRWAGNEGGSTAQFALVLFCGMIPYNILSETLGRAPGLIAAHATYVKKVVFPLEVLPLTILGASLVHAAISLLILIAGAILVTGQASLQVLWTPVVLLPLCLLAAGLGWFLAALGVFLKDLQHVVTLMLQLLMFLSPIFYPASSVPERLQPLLHLNPLVPTLENMRRIVLWGQSPDWHTWLTTLLVGMLAAIAGLAWFNKTRKAFADVL